MCRGKAAAGSLSCVPEPFLMHCNVLVSPAQSPGAQQGAVGRVWWCCCLRLVLVLNNLLPNATVLHMAGINFPPDPPREQVTAAFPILLGMAETKGHCPGLGVAPGVGL